MKQKTSPIDYAVMAVETMMRKFKAKDLPPIKHFHYHQGVFLSGVYRTYLLSKNEEYFNYMKDWVDSVIDDEGNFLGEAYYKDILDDIQPGILLFPLIERTKEKKYEMALEKLMKALEDFPKIPEGGFYHRTSFPSQMWLDGLYMAGPIGAHYAKYAKRPDFLEVAHRQVMLMREKTLDEKTGLWYHAYDDSRAEAWCDKTTGLASEFWGRSIGWVPVAILDEMDYMEKDSQFYSDYTNVVVELLTTLCKYQGKNNLWYQVVNKENEPGNWPEISCSCLYVAAICKAIRIGILDKSYLENAQRGYVAVIDSLDFDGDDLLVQGVCIGTGVGDYEHYCNRPTSTNDLHGVGAFLLMCTEAARLEEINS